MSEETVTDHSVLALWDCLDAENQHLTVLERVEQLADLAPGDYLAFCSAASLTNFREFATPLNQDFEPVSKFAALTGGEIGTISFDRRSINVVVYTDAYTRRLKLPLTGSIEVYRLQAADRVEPTLSEA